MKHLKILGKGLFRIMVGLCRMVLILICICLVVGVTASMLLFFDNHPAIAVIAIVLVLAYLLGIEDLKN